MRFGRFDDERREYVITRPDTPLPWINYLGSEDYLGLISNTAGGYSFYRDARLRRLTRYRYNNAPLDVGGRYVYIRDDDSGAYWSPSWQPVGGELEDYSCRHGLGYTVIGSRTSGIRTETTYFVPAGETLEIWRVRVTNERAEPARLSLFSAVEWSLWDAHDDATNFQRNYSIGEVEVEDGVIFHKTEYRERREHFAYFACSEPLAGFDTPRDAFLGPYRGWDRPLAVERGQTTDSIAHGWQPMGSHHVRLELAPGETRELIFVLGYAENPAEAKFDPPGSQIIAKGGVRPTIARYLRPDEVGRALDDAGRPVGRAARQAPGRTRPTSTSTAWSTPGTPTSAWSRSTSRARPRCSSRASAGAWAFATPTRTCSVSCTWSPSALAQRILDISCHPAPERRRLSPVPAADQARQRCGRLRLQRRSRVARAGRGRLPA